METSAIQSRLEPRYEALRDSVAALSLVTILPFRRKSNQGTMARAAGLRFWSALCSRRTRRTLRRIVGEAKDADWQRGLGIGSRISEDQECCLGAARRRAASFNHDPWHSWELLSTEDAVGLFFHESSWGLAMRVRVSDMSSRAKDAGHLGLPPLVNWSCCIQ